MRSTPLTRQYVMLRPVGCHAAGFARLEVCRNRGLVTVHASSLPDCETLRTLLLSGHSPDSAVLDLGLITVTPSHMGTLHRENLPLTALQGYDAILLTSDWPDPQIKLCGFLSKPPRCTLWQLQEALRRYLTVPCGDMTPTPSLEIPDPPAPPLEPLPARAALMIDFPGEEAALEPDSVLRLHDVRWPESVGDLREYFDTLSPCAPFEAPGWRFVRVPLKAGSPSDYGMVGVHISGHAVDRAAYALPGRQDVLPPGGLQGYSWQPGRDGQGYWLLIQEA